MSNRDSKGRFIKGHLLGHRFEKGQISWNKGRTNLNQFYDYSKSEQFKRQVSIVNTGNHITAKRFKHKDGYIYFKYKSKLVKEHHYVWLMKNDWSWMFIPEGWCVHHINGIKDDNRIENLICVPIPIHKSGHNLVDIFLNPNHKYFGINHNMRGD